MQFINNCAKSFTIGSGEKLNAENVSSIYSEFALPDIELICPCFKDASFASMFECPDKYIKFSKCSCVLNFYIECPGLFVTDADINGDKDVNLPFIYFHHYKNVIFCYLNKQILPYHGKTYPSCINIEFF